MIEQATDEPFFSEDLRAPFPWFGGKSLAAEVIWERFGCVNNYVEPFLGSGAVLLARPHPPKVETVNDRDGLVANFWRAVKLVPDQVAKHADWPVNEADLHARHAWLVKQIPLVERLIDDPDWCDPKIAGWWVWGICAWIGGGWCSKDERLWRCAPKLSIPGHGIHAPTRVRRELSAVAAGEAYRQAPMIGAPGNGVHAPTRKKKPLTHRDKGVHASGAPLDLFQVLSRRFRYVRVVCGNWDRVLGRSTLGIDTAHGMTPCGVLLDSPYSHELRDKRLYREDQAGLAAEVAEWARANGDNPQLRIALCGLEGEHVMPGWDEVAWCSTSSAESRTKERIWFSPHCLPPGGPAQRDLFEIKDGST